MEQERSAIQVAGRSDAAPRAGADGVLVRLEGICKAYGENVILEGVDLDVHAGESVSITSPSGSGKSTVLSILGLLLEPDSGKVTVGGRDMTAADDGAVSHARQRDFGFLFQHTQLIGSLRAVENAAVPARFAADLDFDAESRARELLVEFGLEDRLEHFPYQLSVGQKRRVAAARAVLMDPPVIIADEPTNDLDPDSSARVLDRLFSMVAGGHALVLATHDADLARRTDREFRLKGRRLVQVR